MATEQSGTVSLQGVVDRIRSEYESERKSKMHIQDEALGSEDFAVRVLESVAVTTGFTISIETGVDYVYARVDGQRASSLRGASSV